MSGSRSIDNDFLFALFEVQRLLRLYADKHVSRYGLTQGTLGGSRQTGAHRRAEAGRRCRVDGDAADHADSIDRRALQLALDRGEQLAGWRHGKS